ncbi:trypsin-like peptidase domain-containing protein [Actinophytocola algeriensis]|uniref:Serine protease n=1 Tax=Actinophytocola algeriensis TaxID=1768010 RepID=A0A7W7VGY5_9PSEU|nr:trypsin-like peptidase domain-containing protein [Actinophytocola algeriensis]MBB4909614.1 V8-like Glu-specific endopeptidase [Actinophytocola algeriensis]MBE1475604.1 V8-like Glu-specific endopeptidase [Actinophytocola algeriensis]
MPEVDVEDRQRLVRLLSDVPGLATEESRRDLLVLAGLDELAANIDVSGPPPEAVARIVHHLAGYGHASSGPHALGLFCNLVKGFVGAERQAVLADLLTGYDLMTPVAAAPGVGTWRGTTTDLTETVIRSNAVHPIAFLSTAVAVARCVAFLEVTAGGVPWSGTGFLVGPDLLLTTNRVLPRADLALTTVFRFNFQHDADGRPEQHDDHTAAPGGLFHTSKHLDYTLVRLTGRPGDRWGYLPLTAETPAAGDRVTVIHHPGGGPKRIALRDNVVEYVGGGVVQYVTPTLPGSSGAPVLTDEWRVCAVHHAAGPAPQRTFLRNEGVLVAAILRDLPTSAMTALARR